jgi:hypothetical protein
VELLYRLWIKALLRPSFRPHSFLPFQFGAGIAVVELVIWTVQRAIDNSLGRAFTHLISLDFINAFNTADRQGVCLGNAASLPSSTARANRHRGHFPSSFKLAGRKGGPLSCGQHAGAVAMFTAPHDGPCGGASMRRT